MGRNFTTPDQSHGSPEKLLAWANQAESYKAGRRLMCIRMLMMEKDASVNEAARIFGVSVRTVNEWLRQWNSGGKEALRDVPKPGRPPKLKPEHKDRVKALIAGQAEQDTRLTIKGNHGFLKG